MNILLAERRAHIMATKQQIHSINLHLLGEGFIKGAEDGFISFNTNYRINILTADEVHHFCCERLATVAPERHSLGFFTGWLVALHESVGAFDPPDQRYMMPLGNAWVYVGREAKFLNSYQAGHMICCLQCKAPCPSATEITNRLFDLMAIGQAQQEPEKYLYDTGKLVGWLLTATRKSGLFEQIAQKPVQQKVGDV
jgi:hypothetical protein